MMRDEVQAFIDNGGFVNLRKNIELNNERQLQKQELELEQLKLQVEELKQQPLERKNTRQLAKAAIFISVTTLLFEI